MTWTLIILAAAGLALLGIALWWWCSQVLGRGFDPDNHKTPRK